jgi:hypothetical protein
MRNHIIEADAGAEKKSNRWAIFTDARGGAGTCEGASGEIFARLVAGNARLRGNYWIATNAGADRSEEEKRGLMSKRLSCRCFNF